MGLATLLDRKVYIMIQSNDTTKTQNNDPVYTDSRLSSRALAAKVERYVLWRRDLNRRIKQGLTTTLDYELRDYIDTEVQRMHVELWRRDRVAEGVQS